MAPARQQGFTLIELVVAMAAGMIVVIGATTVMITGLHVNEQVTGRVQVTAQGRTGMEDLVQQLNSGCLVSGVSPVQAASSAGIAPAQSSDATHLVFVSGVGDNQTNTPTEHIVSIDANGALIDAAYTNTGGQPPSIGNPATWTFSSTPAQQQVLIEHAAADGTNPIFSYLSYANPSNASADSLLGAAALTVPLGANAPSVAEVDIDLVAAPAMASEGPAEGSTLTDSAIFRFTATASSGTTPGEVNYPCE